MPTAQQQRTNRVQTEERCERDFEAQEQARWRRDEVTDQAERLASPMENPFDYFLGPEGLTTDLGESMRTVFEDGYRVARAKAALDPRWEFEANRRGIELQEFEEIEHYAANLEAETWRGDVRITSLSLDGSDYAGMQAIAEALGHSLPVGLGSEAILQNRMWVPDGLVVLSPIPDAVRIDGIDIGAYDRKRLKLLVRVVTSLDTPDEHAALIKRIRQAYDNVLTQRTGRRHFAGRDQISNEDAKTFIEKQSDLIDAHMQIVGRVRALTSDPEERNRLLAPHRYDLSAALDDLLHGRKVTSLQDSGDGARAEGRTFPGDCPTGETTSAAGQAERLGYGVERWSRGVCANCDRHTNIWKTKDGGCNICKDCADAHTRQGDIGLKIQREKAVTEKRRETRRAQTVGKTATRHTLKAVKTTARRHGDVIKTEHGRLKYQENLTVGGTKVTYIDVATGQTVTP